MRIGDATNEMERAVEATIAAMPDWTGSSITYQKITSPIMSPMHRSVDSDGFAVHVGTSSFFVKILHPEILPFTDVADVFQAAEAAAAVGAAPKALHCHPDAGAIVFEHLGEEWRTAMADDLLRPNLMTGIIEAKKRIQSGVRFRKSWSVFDGIRGLLPSLESFRHPMTNVHSVVDAIQDIEAAFSAAGYDRKPCHADGLASNVMIGPDDRVRLVDFDAACNTDPLYDIGVTLNEAYAFEEEMESALEAYEGSLRKETLNRCRLYAIADDFYWALWSSRMDVVSRRHGIEFLKYAQWRFLRCGMAIQDSNFERRLRMI